MKSTKSLLPWLWVFMLVNYLYCDVVTLLDPVALKGVLEGHAAGGAVAITPEMLLASSVLMEIPMAMIMLARVLPYMPNRWLNVLAAGFMALVQIGSLAVGTPATYYLFFSAIEVGTLAGIALLALRWTAPSPTLAASPVAA